MARNRGIRLAQRWAGFSGLALVLGGLATGCGEPPAPAPRPQEAGAGGATSCARDTDCEERERCVEGACLPEGCSVEGQTCSRNGRGVLTCATAGQEETLTLCRGTDRCVALEDGRAECRASACAADEWTCADPGVAQHCNEDGSGVVEELDCTELGQACHEGACVPDVCGSEGCESEACEPGERACLGDRVTECAADGSGFEPTEEDCGAAGQACFDGACAARVCDTQYVCRNNVSIACVDNGTREKSTACGELTMSFCHPLTGRCQPYVCLPGSAVCNGWLATRCADDGSEPLATGFDCAQQGETCWDGGCAALVCSAGFRCVGRALSLCGKAGSAWTPVKDCQPGTECDANAGACTPTTCTPNAPVCRGGVATTCEASGVGYVAGGTDCVSQGKTCLVGECVEPLCAAGEAFCEGKELRQCDAIGASWSLSDTCTGSEVCDAEHGACVPGTCAPGSALCAGNVLTTCNAEGSGPEPGGLDCSASGHVCDLGQCAPQICEPKLSFCGGGHVLLCNDAGTSAAPLILCAEGQGCTGAPGVAACVTNAEKNLP